MFVKQIRIDFQVTEEVKRYVYVYLAAKGKDFIMIDSGVYGSEQVILDAVRACGLDISNLKGLFLTHAHPDHMGSAAFFREKYKVPVYASPLEAKWISDVELQFKARPIPNFFKLAGKSVSVDHLIGDGDLIMVGEEFVVKVISAKGHSMDDLSFQVEDAVFCGDAIPVRGDIPIFINREEALASLETLLALEDVSIWYPAWDKTYQREEMEEKLKDAMAYMDMLEKVVCSVDNGMDLSDLVKAVCGKLQMPMLMTNPLFARTVDALRKGR